MAKARSPSNTIAAAVCSYRLEKQFMQSKGFRGLHLVRISPSIVDADYGIFLSFSSTKFLANMATYGVEILIDEITLRALYDNGYKLAVGKTFIHGKPNVIWQAVSVFPHNLITWREDFGLYASPAKIEQGAEIFQVSRSDYPANTGKVYVLNNDGVISRSEQSGKEGAYSLNNEYSGERLMTIGLNQDAKVNGVEVKGNACVAKACPYKSSIVFDPFNTLFLSMMLQISANEVYENWLESSFVYEFGEKEEVISVSFNINTGWSGPTAKDLAEVERDFRAANKS